MNFIEYSDLEITKLWNDYAETRNKGLKKIANKKLSNLIEFVNSKDDNERKAFVDYLCNVRFEKETIEDFQQPLIVDLILPIIIQKVEMEEIPYLRWIYELNICNFIFDKIIEIDKIKYYNSEEILIKANKLDPSDMKTVYLLIDMYMYDLSYGSHHFPEYILINEKDINYSLSKVTEFVKKYESKINCKDDIYKDIKYYTDLYESWFTYKNENSNLTFDEWCKNNNKTYSWISAYYYD